jgi:hypothetical protein
MNDYDILGVSPTAGPAEITAAYRRRVRLVHPDLDPRVTDSERRAREDATVALNLAYASAIKRARHGDPGDATGGFAFRATASGACDLCGARPAARHHVTVRSAWMMSALPISRGGDIELCAACASNLRVDEPPSDDIDDDVTPVRKRGHRRRVRVVTVLVAAAIVVARFATFRATSAPGDLIGRCVATTDRPRVVSCGSPNDGRIDAVEPTSSRCPAGDSSWAEQPRVVICFETPA